jgi:hypothetical protein
MWRSQLESAVLGKERHAVRKSIVIQTIADLGERVRLVAHCEARQHLRDLDVRQLIELYGALTLTRLRLRLRCMSCGAHAPTVMQVWDNATR